MSLRVLIVDDEPVARRGLRREVQRMPGLACIGECATRDEAVTAITRDHPDVVLLDVQLGRVTGFDVIEAVGLERMPLIIFVTAYDRHALRAFDVHAVDYVLKPVDPERLHDALARALRLKALEDESSLVDRVERLLELQKEMVPARANAGGAGRIVVPDGARLALIQVDTIDWIEAFGNHVRLHVGSRQYVLRSTMTRMDQRLGAERFVRIRRSALVNLQAIVSLEPYGKGMFTLTLRSGATLVSSRYHQEGLRRLMRPSRS
jgi:two-component system LytT family response regulator